MAYTYTQINGQRVQVSVAAAFQNLRAAFKAATGLDLLVTSGTRTRAEQQHLYNLYRAGKGNLAAVPGSSNHEENGPRGPRALDIRDSGAGAGVTVRNNVRSNWIKANASRYGFNPAGYSFSRIEPWHIEYTGALNNTVGGGSSATGSCFTSEFNTVQKRAAVQGGYNALGYKLKQDGISGPATRAAIRDFQSKHGLPADGVHGPATERALVAAVKAKTAPVKPAPVATGSCFTAEFNTVAKRAAVQGGYNALGYKLKQDGISGPATRAAIRDFQSKHGLPVDGVHGPATERALIAAVKKR
jgi:peptidoglycan hydrolase-like protein with peptidoglycan-binding domain